MQQTETAAAENKVQTFFVGIGAQKAATSWLAEYLEDHPKVGFSPIKELHYFDAEFCSDHCGSYHTRMIERLIKTSSAMPDQPSPAQMRKLRALSLRVQMNDDPLKYRTYFDKLTSPRDEVIGEITPSYSMMDAAGFAAIREIMPGAKFIFILRDPLTRYMSQIRFEEAQRPETGFKARERILSHLYDTQYMLRTDYQRTLVELEKVVPAEDICVVFFEHLMSEEQGRRELKKITSFLGIRQRPANRERKVNAGKSVEFDQDEYRRIVRRFARIYEYVFDRYGSEVPASWHQSYALLGGERSSVARFYEDVFKVRLVGVLNALLAPFRKLLSRA